MRHVLVNSTGANMLMPWQAAEKLLEESSAKESVMLPKASVASLSINRLQSHSKPGALLNFQRLLVRVPLRVNEL